MVHIFHLRVAEAVCPLVAILLFLVAACSPSQAQTGLTGRLSLARLPGVAIAISPIDPAAADDGLTADVVKKQVVAALDGAKITQISSDALLKTAQRPQLFVDVGLLPLPSDEYIYSIQISVRQRVASLGQPGRTVETALPMTAITWSTSNVFGITPKENIAADTRATIAELLEHFTESFTRANPR